MDPFLAATEIVDWQAPPVRLRAAELSRGLTDPVDIARSCFEWVRDQIQHSSDFQRGPVTCIASQVLAEGTGFCYAKSHLLAALLRANGIPAGFGYQRLSLDEAGSAFCLHGFNAAYLPVYGWYRMDARGNKPGVDARFTPPVERLAFAVSLPGERTFPEILPAPLPAVVSALGRHSRWEAFLGDLPDWELPSLG